MDSMLMARPFDVRVTAGISKLLVPSTNRACWSTSAYSLLCVCASAGIRSSSASIISIYTTHPWLFAIGSNTNWLLRIHVTSDSLLAIPS